MKTKREQLMLLQEQLAVERGRILADTSAFAGRNRLPAQLIRALADIDSAARAVAAELARHMPRLGYGSET